MRPLCELIGRCITPEPKRRHRPKIEILTEPINSRSEKPHDKFEAEVFNYLLTRSEELSIKNVMKSAALLVDGAVELLDGRRLAVEIKLYMNWARACLAGWEFRNFLKRKDRCSLSVEGGIVIFKDFSGDWKRHPAAGSVENGWGNWYRAHADVDGLRVDLLQLRGTELESFPQS